MFRRRQKLSKRVFTSLLMIILSLNSFAAIVSDNDGSAFVTKSEFDNLKRSFADQIENYNTSIDNKIDGAIASYLSGIKLQKREQIDRLLDENAIYNNQYLIHWKSNTDTRRINLDYTYINVSSTLNCFMSQINNGCYYGGTYSWSNWHNGSENNVLDPVEVCWKYKYRDGSTDKIKLYYEMVKNDMQINWFFQFPLNNSNWNSGIPSAWELTNLITLNGGDLKQNQLNNKIATYYRYYNYIWECWSVWKQAYFTLRYNETPTNALVMHPFSTAYEKVWWKDDNTLNLGFSSSEGWTTERLWGDPGPTPDGYPDLIKNPGTIKIRLPLTYWCPWQLMTDDVQLKKREIKNLTDISDKNFAFENGLVVGTIPAYNEEMELTAKFKVTEPGTVYMYVGDNRITNWKNSDYKGKKVSITDTSKEYEIKYDNIQKNQTIWILYEPIFTSSVKNLFLTDLYIEK